MAVDLQTALDGIAEIHARWHHQWQVLPTQAPIEVDELLKDAALELHTELARNLKNLAVDPDSSVTRAHLINCWTTLGSLIESSLTFFLCVHVDAHRSNLQLVTNVKASADPNENKLYKLLHIYNDVVWTSQQKIDYFSFVEDVRRKRNEIHGFKTQTEMLGTMSDFRTSVVKYFDMISDIDSQLPPAQPEHDWQ